MKKVILLAGIIFASAIVSDFPGFISANLANETLMMTKIGEIKEPFPGTENNYFWRICDLCNDMKGNLYVADSGWNKIFKFDSDFNSVISIGNEGQGPGEFSAKPRGAPLKIHFGNDGKIYVLDPSLRRLSQFEKNWKFQKSFPLNKSNSDSPLVNSNGDIFLLSNQNDSDLIRIFNPESDLKMSFFKAEYHYDYPYLSPPEKMLKMPVDDRNLKKFITKDDHIVILSNYSLTVFHFDPNLNLIDKFRIIDSKEFESDFKKKLTKAISFGGFVVPFQACLDNKNHLYVFYSYETDTQQKIYQYDLKGRLLSVYRLPEKASTIYSVNDEGVIFGVIDSWTGIGVYKTQKSSEASWIENVVLKTSPSGLFKRKRQFGLNQETALYPVTL